MARSFWSGVLLISNNLITTTEYETDRRGPIPYLSNTNIALSFITTHNNGQWQRASAVSFNINKLSYTSIATYSLYVITYVCFCT